MHPGPALPTFYKNTEVPMHHEMHYRSSQPCGPAEIPSSMSSHVALNLLTKIACSVTLSFENKKSFEKGIWPSGRKISVVHWGEAKI